MPQIVLVTGGAGYIGSTICSALEDAGHRPVVLDSLISGDSSSVGDRPFYRGDIGDPNVIDEIFANHPDLSCTIHCAALAIVPDSVERPLDYYTNNVSGSIKSVQQSGRSWMPRQSCSAHPRPCTTPNTARK